MQKIRLAMRGWQRRREESQRDFVARNAAWGVAPAAASAAPAKARTFEIDIDGLTVAYLDDSGRLAHYLDTESGDIIDVPLTSQLAAPRFRRVPSRTAESDAADRRAFLGALDPSPSRDALARSADDADAFRRAVAADRTTERAWFNFRNDRAIAAIEAWLETL